MRQIGSILLITLFSATLLGCGGGSKLTATDPGANDPASSGPRLAPVGPTSVTGSHAVSVVPDRLNVRTGLEGDKLEAVVGRYGCTVLSQHNGWATLELPGGSDLDAAAKALTKEYAIVSAEPVHRIMTPRTTYPVSQSRTASFTPLDPFYSAQFFGLDTSNNTFDNVYAGQALPMNIQGFNAAWDIALNDNVSVEPVEIAIIDAGWEDYSTVNRPDFDETILDDTNSGFVADDGTFTPGLTAAAWETFSEGHGDPPTYFSAPYRDVGEKILGVLAARINDYTPQAIDLDTPPDGIQEDEVWNEGIAGINPNATYMLIKTGELDVDTWTFTDNEIAESIDHAVSAGANIIVLGMFGVGPVGSNVSTALQNARDNNVLVFSPAGDVIDSFNGSATPPFFDETPVDITVDSVSPASDPNCVSVCCTGLNRLPDLPDVDGVPNDGVGWDTVRYNPPFDEPFFTVTNYSNTGADIAGAAFGIGFGLHPFLYDGGSGDGSQGSPFQFLPGDTYTVTVDSFGSIYAVAYVAGAASQVFQTLSYVNGTPPSDDDVLNELMSTVQLPNLDGTNGGGLLNAGAAMASAINGGSLMTVLPALEFVDSSGWWSQPLDAVTRGTDLTVTPMVVNGTAPFTLEVNWGDGSGAVTVDPWTNGDPLTLTGGYTTAGNKEVNVTVTDDDDRSINTTFALRVINPLAASISITNADGSGVPLNNIPINTDHRFSANATNVYTGMVGDPPAQNTTTLNWYFDGLPSPLPDPLPAPDATGPSPIHRYTSTGPVQMVLVITDDFRPPAEFRVNLTVTLAP